MDRRRFFTGLTFPATTMPSPDSRGPAVAISICCTTCTPSSPSCGRKPSPPHTRTA